MTRMSTLCLGSDVSSLHAGPSPGEPCVRSSDLAVCPRRWGYRLVHVILDSTGTEGAAPVRHSRVRVRGERSRLIAVMIVVTLVAVAGAVASWPHAWVQVVVAG